MYSVVPGSTAGVIKASNLAMYLHCCKAGPFIMDGMGEDLALQSIAFDVAGDTMGVRPCLRYRG